MQTLQDEARIPLQRLYRNVSPFRDPIEEPPVMTGIQACLSNLFLNVYCHNNIDIFLKKTIPAVVAVKLTEEMGKVGPNSSPSFAAIRVSRFNIKDHHQMPY
ncbi:hypothetical protein V6N13_009756 [Hibiscus sabdariffa]|uniref:Uncharacterized protein n=2 Tax=Hibiscus sabdariffa TaxID=183260 RepID=A0ABR2B9J1_9ROSI